MNICIVSTNYFYSNYGGGEVYVRNIVDGFIKQKQKLSIDISVISWGKEKKNEYHGVPVYFFSNKKELKEIFNNISPNIVHANGLFEYVIPVCKELDIRTVITVHDGMYICPQYTMLDYNERLCTRSMSIKNCLKCCLYKIRGGRIAYPLMKLIPPKKYIELGRKVENHHFIYFITPIFLSALGIQRKIDYWNNYICKADVIIQLSRRMMAMVKINGIDVQKTKLLPNGVPIPNCIPSFPTIDNGIHFYYMGRVSHSKGVHILLKAFHGIESQQCKLHLIGANLGPSIDKYTSNLINKYRKDPRIEWLPQIPHEKISDVIQNYHVMVHPSIANECCPLSIAESLSNNKFVIATRCGGPEDQINEGINGILVEPNNIEALRSAIQSYIKNPVVPKENMYISIEEHLNHLYNIYSSI